MKKIYLKISKKDGLNYSKVSGDKNKIHIDKRYGYNSIYGETICHGTNIINKFFHKINFYHKIRSNNFNVSIDFLKYASYEKKIIIFYTNNKKEHLFHFYQNNEKIINLKINFKSSNNLLLDKFNKKIKIKFKGFSSKLNNQKTKTFYKLLNELSKYVGNIYPGKNSAINKINIDFDSTRKLNKNHILIKSFRINKRFPLVKNQLQFNNFLIDFETMFLPILNIKLKKPSKIFIKKINNIKKNVLIIGASSGLGNDLLNLYKFNKKIKIFATYYRNKIKLNNKNIFKINFDINKNIKKIVKIIKKNDPINIYYCPTPKIYSQSLNKNFRSEYEKFYLDKPLKLIKLISNFNFNFFYPSTIFINKKYSGIYEKIKLKAERKLKLINYKNLKISIVRIEQINTRQNINISGVSYPNFRDYLFKDKKLFKNTFFDLS